MKKILGILLILAMGIPAYASITVSPTRLEINANKIKNNYATTAIEVKGAPDKPIRYRAYTEYFKISDKASIDLVDDKTDKYNMSSKVRFVPSEFTVPPGRSQKLRVNIANVRNLPDGESRAIIFLEDVNEKEMSIPNDSGISTQLIIKTRVGVPVYVDKGNFTKKADVENFSIVREKDGLYTNMDIISSGNTRVRYSGMIQVIEGKKLIEEYALTPGVVAHNATFKHRQKIETTKVKKAGDYTLRLILSYSDEKDIKKNIKKDAILRITDEI